VTGGFSAGARTCIGKHLAHIESKIALVKFMKRYKKVTLPKKDFKMEFKFLYSPEDFESTMLINDEYHI
jgi:cytochrome P450